MSYQCTRLALAVLSLGAGCAAHADVTIYGTLLPFVDSYRTTGATVGRPDNAPNQVKSYPGTNVPSMGRESANTSNLGFKGDEDLGDGLKAVWQIESQIGIDGDNSPPSLFATRNTRLGLASARWGTLFAGNWDTPYKAAQIVVNPFVAVNPFDDYLIGNPGFGVPGTTTQSGRINGKADASFSRRQGNSVQYWSPELAGFSLRADYSFGEGRTGANGNTAGINPNIWSASLAYKAGALSLNYAYEQHRDYFGLSQLGGSTGATSTNTRSRDNGNMLVAIYKLPTDTRIGLILERLSYHSDDSAAAAVTNFKRNAWYTLIQQNFGPHEVWASYGRAYAGSCNANGIACSTNGLGAAQWSLGASYGLSSRTKVYGAVYGINNQDSASYVIAGAPVGAASPGASSRGVGAGILHMF
ncbi:porin [Crenobacter sp. SG2303]|uniref:Porin n=1 Tax=Crenobacter oryzisoli TaxID=3056844 RepID=A0ABT7XPF1_9NEIS|nr:MULTISPECIES: porin [unclassified Crenobacter]MDN0075664.1 porin [Crenobacter sp. SG2303]MDN0083772.1 porin [Crenobacter sp. SG2305]